MMQVITRLHRHDERLLYYMVERRHGTLDDLMRWATRLGDPPVVIGIALLLMAMTESRPAGMYAAFVLLSSHLAVQALKRIVSRARPALPSGIELLLQAPDRFSFPSGHAAASLSVAVGLYPFVPLELGLPILGVSLTTGLSRCYLGVHYPGDVAAGWLLAWLAFYLAQLFAFPFLP
jgi:undecaprenyl-diphosphatase